MQPPLTDVEVSTRLHHNLGHSDSLLVDLGTDELSDLLIMWTNNISRPRDLFDLDNVSRISIIRQLVAIENARGRRLDVAATRFRLLAETSNAAY